MIAVTGTKNVLARVPRHEELIMKRAGPRDRITYICGRKCAERGRGLSVNLVELPDMSRMPRMDGTYVVDRCWRGPKNRPCTDYEITAFKYVWGLIHEVRRFLEAGLARMPEYWLLLDDDTFVHAPNMMRAIEAHGGKWPFDPLRQPAAWASDGPCFVCGGAGLVLSGALAVELATRYADRWLEDQRNGTLRKNFYYDTHMPKVIGWVAGAKIWRIPEMSPFSPADRQLCRWRRRRPPCICAPECDCAPSEHMATWHMVSFNRSLEVLSGVS